jgi:hypothetical protein
MHYIPPTQKNIWRLALFYSHFSIQRKVIFESFLYDPPGPIRRISYKILPHAKMVKTCQKNDFLILGKNGLFIISNTNINKRVHKIKEYHFLVPFLMLIFYLTTFFPLGIVNICQKLGEKMTFLAKKKKSSKIS